MVLYLYAFGSGYADFILCGYYACMPESGIVCVGFHVFSAAGQQFAPSSGAEHPASNPVYYCVQVI